MLSSSVLGMGPLPVGITTAFSFFPSFLHSKVKFTLKVFARGARGTQISSRGAHTRGMGGGQCTFGSVRRSVLRLSAGGMRPSSERSGSTSVEPQLSFSCPFEKPLSVSYSATPLVVTRYCPPSLPTHMVCPSPKFPAPTSFGLIYLSQCWQFAASY